MLICRRGCALFGAMVALLCPSWAAALVVEGTAAYLERIAMPPDAVFEARVEDVSRADAPSTLLGRHRIERAGNPPYRFRIEIDDAALKPTGRYAVRATVRVGERLMFTTDTFTPFVAGAAGAPLNLLLVSVRGGGSAAPRPPGALTGRPAARPALPLAPDLRRPARAEPLRRCRALALRPRREQAGAARRARDAPVVRARRPGAAYARSAGPAHRLGQRPERPA
jgi:uncharacterized lipoprotein YbaY